MTKYIELEPTFGGTIVWGAGKKWAPQYRFIWRLEGAAQMMQKPALNILI